METSGGVPAANAEADMTGSIWVAILVLKFFELWLRFWELWLRTVEARRRGRPGA